MQSKSVALVVSRGELVREPNHFEIQGSLFGDEHNLCSSERFFEQTVIGNCTAFLIAPDVMVTAGHCIISESACENSAFIFGYDSDKVYKSNHSLTSKVEDVYFCESVVKLKYEVNFGLDFSIVRLDRKVKDREPLKFRESGRIGYWDKVYVIGHPAGLSTKVSMDAKIRDNAYNAYFEANIDSMIGGSGSPVINQSTGLVEGILINGEADFVLTKEGCQISNVCSETDNKCTGEVVQRFSELLPYIP